MRDWDTRACIRVAARPVLNFAANMSDDEVDSPRGAAEEPELKKNSGEEISPAKKNRFRKKHEWKQVSHILKEGKSEADIQNLVFECAKEQVQQWMPTVLEDYKKLDSDLYCWKKKESYPKAHGVSVTVYWYPFHYSCDCETLLHVVRNQNSITIETRNDHNANSHKQDSLKKLKMQQKSEMQQKRNGPLFVSLVGLP